MDVGNGFSHVAQITSTNEAIIQGVGVGVSLLSAADKEGEHDQMWKNY